MTSKRSHGSYSWFTVGLALFCAFVAMEEISWGQRIVGSAAPEYFLEHNYQQELNLHNVVDSALRALLMQVVLLGFGVVLSAAAINPKARRFLARLSITAPPPQLIPGFLSMSAMYAWYPWSLTGEWVECAMGLGFVYVASWNASAFLSTATGVVYLSKTLAAIAILTAATMFGLSTFRSSDPDDVALAQKEVSALVADFNGPNLHTRCGIHKRLYTFAIEYGQSYLFDGEFSKQHGNDDQTNRAAYLLDPWNSAYWLVHRCSNGREVRFVYSFGPNRRRDSTDWEIRGDDVGSHFGSE